MTPDELLLLRAVSIAQQAQEHGDHPFGALLAVASGRVLFTAENAVVTGSAATGHA